MKQVLIQILSSVTLTGIFLVSTLSFAAPTQSTSHVISPAIERNHVGGFGPVNDETKESLCLDACEKNYTICGFSGEDDATCLTDKMYCELSCLDVTTPEDTR